MTTLIFGATGGIGGEVARLWPDRNLWLSGRDQDKLAVLAGELGAAFRAADVGYESHVKAVLDAVSSPIDALIYAAGVALPEPIEGASSEAVRRSWNANYFGALWALKHALPKLRKGGRAYFLGARPELVTARGFSQYAASKAALARALEIARLEHRDLILTLVLPPAVDTPLWAKVGRVPKGAMRPQEVAAAIARDFAGEGRAELRIEPVA